MSKNVVIIGAGPGGLAASLLLASSGLRVTLLERLPRVGGRTSAHEARGFRFDTGPTFFLYPQILEEIFAAAGYRLQDHIDLIRLDPQYRLIFGAGGKLDATPDVGRMERHIAAIAPGDASALHRFLADNRTKLNEFRAILESPFLSWRDLCNRDLIRLLPLVRPWLPLESEMRRYFADPRIRLAFCFQSKYLGMSPFRCPSLFSILSFIEYEYGVFHPVGGCSAIMEAMAQIAKELGVDVRLNEAVQGLDFTGKRVTGVYTARQRYPADAVVINADFAHAMQRLVPDGLRKRWSNRKIAKKKFSCSTFMLYLGIKGSYPEIPHHSIYVADDYHRNLHEIEHQHVLSENPSFYVQNASVTDPTLAPPGHSTLYMLIPVTHQHPNVDWSREYARYRALALRHLTKIGIKDIDSRICYERILTPTHWQEDYAVHQGATFNLAHNFRQMLHLRPRNRFEDLESVYLVGGGTHPGSGLPVIFESARISSRLLIEDLQVHAPWVTSLARGSRQSLTPIKAV